MCPAQRWTFQVPTSQVLCLLVLRMGKLRHRGWILVQGCWSLSSIEIGWGLCDPEAHFINNNIPSLFLVHIYFSFPGHIFLNLAQVLEVSDCYFGDYVLNCHVFKTFNNKYSFPVLPSGATTTFLWALTSIQQHVYRATSFGPELPYWVTGQPDYAGFQGIHLSA